MRPLAAINEFVVKFANVNGSGSASANNLFARAVFRMGVPVSPRNIFPSNIQGLPTWYEVRISEAGYLGRRGGVDFMVAMNPQTMAADIKELNAGGFLLFDDTKPLSEPLRRADIHAIGVPITRLCLECFGNHKQRQLFKNIAYVGALCALLDMELPVLEALLSERFRAKKHLLDPNLEALHLGYGYARQRFTCPLSLRIERRDAVGERIFIDGNSAAALGCVYAGATVAAWYPITPSTSLVDAFGKYAERLRRDLDTQQRRFAVVQAEDELAAIGMVIGAAWNGARAFTATSGPGVSLMQEFLGLAYYAEIPVVLFDVQRAGPSTGMPTRTQQSDILACAYASHGDTKHVLLFPANPTECFELAARAFDLAERLQTPVIVLSDLDIGMNDWLSDPFSWDDGARYDRGKVLDHDTLDALQTFGRYMDVDGDGIAYRTVPGTHPDKGAFFTRGSSHDPFARYSEDSAIYQDNMLRLLRKFNTAARLTPNPIIRAAGNRGAVIYYGSTGAAIPEALDRLASRGIVLDTLCIRAFPFSDAVYEFINEHDLLFVIEQNRDGQMRTLLINEGSIAADKLAAILHYDGSPITAKFIVEQIGQYFAPAPDKPELREAK